VAQADIIDTFGADLSTGIIEACQVTNCVVCRADNSLCATCDTANGYYHDATNNLCTHYTLIADYFGANLAAGTVDSCTIPNCLDCKANHNVCNRCDVPNTYYKNTASGTCVFVSSIPSGQGGNATTGIFENCWLSNCINCQAVSAACQVCDVVNGYYKNQSNGHCQLYSTIASFYGPNINTGLVEACSDPHCENCKSGISQCDLCDVSNNYFFQVSSQSCIIYTSIQSGYGGKTSDGKIYACDSTGCTNCQLNYMICVACDTASNYYLDTTSDRCVLVGDIPSRYGANTGDGTITSCQDANCLWCRNDYTQCTACDVANSYYLNTVAKTCTFILSIPAGSGANSSTGVVENCWPTHCTICQANSLQCTTCDTGSGYYLNTTSHTCTLNTAILDFFGANTATGNIDACTDANCVDCKLNINTCVSCDVANQYYLNTTTHTCIHLLSIPDGSGAKAADGTISFCQDTNCNKCQANFSQCTECDTASLYYLNNATKTCVYVTSIADFFGANLTSGVINPCSVSNCRKCQANNLVCTACDTTTLYFMDNSTATCHYYLDIANSYGADLSTGRIARCTDLNCLLCQATIDQCVGCDMNNGYFLDTTLMVCVTLSQVSLGFGGDLVNGIIVPCAITGCLDCRTDYTGCTSCDTANHYFLNTTDYSCVADSAIPDYYGANLVDGYIEECQITGCRICNTDSSTCQTCDTSKKYYKDTTTGECLLTSEIGDSNGADLFTGEVAACSLTNCKLCKEDNTKCTGCDTSLGIYLNLAKDACTNVFPTGYGPDLDLGAIKPCSDSNCKNCTEDFKTCSFCDVTKGYYLDGTTCSPVSNAPKGMGLNSLTSLLEECETQFCQLCGPDYQQCAGCYESMGYFLEGNICVLMDAKLELKLSSTKPTGVSLSISVSTNPKLSEDNTVVYSELKKQLEWTIVLLKSTTNKPETVELKKAMTALATGITMDLTFQSKLQEKAYFVNCSFPQKYYNVTISSGTLLRISAGKGQFNYEEASGVEEAQGASDTGSAVNSAMGGSLTSSAAFLPVMMTVVALDPTGVLMKFNQILKIINKLYFININYGKRLDAFLKGMGEQQANKTAEESDYLVKHASAYRGKLSKEKLAFDLMFAGYYKPILYVAVWTLTVVHSLLLHFEVKVKPFYLHVMFWSNKAHLIIFNLVFIDFIWYGGHALMHGRGLGIFEQVATFVCLLLTTLDVVLVVRNVVSQRDWLYWILLRRKIDNMAIEERKNMHFEEVRKKRGQKKNKVGPKDGKDKKVVKKVDKNEVVSDDEDDDPKKKKTKNNNRPINYHSTYDEISSNIHLYQISASNLSPLARVYLNPMARVLYMNHIFRAILYQGVILACQYSSGLAIMILILLEVYKLSYSTIFYVKYKYLKNIICLLMEVMQSGFLLCFLVVAMILHPKGFDEIILDFYQDAGIWIVIASCVAEYLLLLTYIGVAAYDFFKNRKSVNRALKKMQYSYIKYGQAPPVLATPGKEAAIDQSKLWQEKGLLTNASVVTLASPMKAKDLNSKGMPTVKTIIGKSANKFAFNLNVKNNQDGGNKIEQAPEISPETKNDGNSTRGSLKKVHSPVTSAMKRIKDVNAKLKAKNSPGVKLELAPEEQINLSPQQNSVANVSGAQISPQPLKAAGIKKPPKLSSLLDLFKKK
jgi:hypothetical protein